MSLLFIRHAETDLAGTFCGHSDPPLNARGHAQAARLAQQLTAKPFDAIYSSDLLRATQTAAHFNLPITTRPALREIHFGDWESLTWPEIEAHDTRYARRWADSFPHLPAPNGETFAHFESRVLRELDHLLHAAGQQSTAVVTHAGVLRLIVRELFGCTDEQAWTETKPYCCTFTYPQDDRLKLNSPRPAANIYGTMEEHTGATP